MLHFRALLTNSFNVGQGGRAGRVRMGENIKPNRETAYAT